jgi:periplasmic copper chaperone A
MSVVRRRVAQLGVVALTAVGWMALSASSASAHVTVTPSETAAGAYTVLTFSVPHGCEKSATTKVSIKMPEKIVAVTPTVNPNWTVVKTMAKLTPPVKDSHGNEITERVTEVVYTARTPLPADMRDTFELSLKLPDSAGESMVFPAVQTCQQGETPWVQVPADGQDAEELDHPAPSFVLSAQAAEGGGAATAPAVDAAGTTQPAAAAGESEDGGTSVVSWIALALGVLGLAAGLLALLRPRRTAA